VAVFALAASFIGINLCDRIVSTRCAGASRTSWQVVILGLDLLAVSFAPWVLGGRLDSPGTLLVLVPLFAAGVRFRVIGAFACWFAACTLLAWRELYVSGGAEGTAVLVQIAVVLLIVGLPAAYLAEHLAGDLAATARSRRAAERRVALLGAVALAMREMNTLDAVAILDRFATAAQRLGASHVELARSARPGSWERAVLPRGVDTTEQDRVAPFDPDVLALEWAPRLLSSTAIEGATHHHAGLRVGDRNIFVRIRTRASSALASEAFAVLVAQAQIALDNAFLHRQLRVLATQQEWRANHDALTGLANRAALRAVLDALFAETDRPPVCVINIDLDGFKPVNDDFGHAAGDVVLRVVAQRLLTMAGADVVPARLGGDEFVVVVHGKDTTTRAMQVLAELPGRIAEPIAIGDTSVRVTASVGAAYAEPGSAIDVEQLLRRADDEMYRNKRGARSTLGVASAIRFPEEISPRS
jgi:diguanylate cyclase (GGDEF)-like protein